MKPIIIYMNKTFNKVVLTKEDFEKYIQDAYNAGYATGYNEGSQSRITYPYYPYYNTDITVPSYRWDWTKITCDTKSAPTAHFATTNTTDELTGILNGEASNAKGEYK